MKLLWLLLLGLLASSECFASGNPVGPLVNASPLTITSGGAWQALFPAARNRSTLLIENPCTATTQGIATAENLFIGFGAQPSGITSGGVIELSPCGSLDMVGYVSQQAVWIYAISTSHAFFAAQTQ